MNNRRTGRSTSRRHTFLEFAGVLLLVIFTAGAVASCSADARYRLKTIIFTGVPPLEEEGAPDEVGTTDQQAVNADQLARQQAHRDALIPRYWQHGPFAAGECERCHSLGQSTSFLGERSAASSSAASATTTLAPSRLTMPRQQLCFTCHTQFSSSRAATHGLAQHQPVAEGECTGCHNPHQSLRQYMLLKADNRELCAGCHEPTALSAAHIATPERDCIDCHNAHVGMTPKLLRSDARELRLLYGTLGNE